MKDWWFDVLEFLNLFLVEIRCPMKWTCRSIGQRWCHRRSCLFRRQNLRTQHLHIFHYNQPCLYVGLLRKRWFRFHWRLRILLRSFLILIWWCKYTNYKFKKKIIFENNHKSILWFVPSQSSSLSRRKIFPSVIIIQKINNPKIVSPIISNYFYFFYTIRRNSIRNLIAGIRDTTFQ